MFLKLKITLLFCLLGELTCSVAFAEEEMPGNFRNPAAVQEVLSGKRKTANAAWWGFDTQDSTFALQGAINSGASKVIVPYMGSDWIVQPIELVSNQEIIFENKVQVAARGNIVPSRPKYFSDKYKSCLFSAYGKENIVLRGYGAVFRMRKSEYAQIPWSNRGSSRHIIRLNGCSNISIVGLTVKEAGGDGIHISTGGQKSIYCRDILIQDVNCIDNYQNAITIGSVDGLLIERCVFQNTTGSELHDGGGPAAGIDFEPWYKRYDILKRIVIRHCIIRNNGMFGIVINLSRINPSSKVDITIEDCNIDYNKRTGLFISRIYDDGPEGLIRFKDVKVKGGLWGARIRSKSSSGAKVVFDNCVWQDLKQSEIAFPIQFYLPEEEAEKVAKFGGVEFANCLVVDRVDRPAIACAGVIESLHDISGDLRVRNTNRKFEFADWDGAVLNNVTLKVLSENISDEAADYENSCSAK